MAKGMKAGVKNKGVKKKIDMKTKGSDKKSKIPMKAKKK